MSRRKKRWFKSQTNVFLQWILYFSVSFSSDCRVDSLAIHLYLWMIQTVLT